MERRNRAPADVVLAAAARTNRRRARRVVGAARAPSATDRRSGAVLGLVPGVRVTGTFAGGAADRPSGAAVDPAVAVERVAFDRDPEARVGLAVGIEPRATEAGEIVRVSAGVGRILVPSLAPVPDRPEDAAEIGDDGEAAAAVEVAEAVVPAAVTVGKRARVTDPEEARRPAVRPPVLTLHVLPLNRTAGHRVQMTVRLVSPHWPPPCGRHLLIRVCLSDISTTP